MWHMLDPFGSNNSFVLFVFMDNKMILNLKLFDSACSVLVLLPARYHPQLVAAVREYGLHKIKKGFKFVLTHWLCSSACLRSLKP